MGDARVLHTIEHLLVAAQEKNEVLECVLEFCPWARATSAEMPETPRTHNRVRGDLRSSLVQLQVAQCTICAI